MGTVKKIRDIKGICMTHFNGEEVGARPEEEAVRQLLGQLGWEMERPSKHVGSSQEIAQSG